MDKLKIIKFFALFLGLCILVCITSIFAAILKRSSYSNQLTSINLDQKGRAKAINVSNGRIYILLEENDIDKIIVVDEKKYDKVFTININ